MLMVRGPLPLMSITEAGRPPSCKGGSARLKLMFMMIIMMRMIDDHDEDGGDDDAG